MAGGKRKIEMAALIYMNGWRKEEGREGSSDIHEWLEERGGRDGSSDIHEWLEERGGRDGSSDIHEWLMMSAIKRFY